VRYAPLLVNSRFCAVNRWLLPIATNRHPRLEADRDGRDITYLGSSLTAGLLPQSSALVGSQ